LPAARSFVASLGPWCLCAVAAILAAVPASAQDQSDRSGSPMVLTGTGQGGGMGRAISVADGTEVFGGLPWGGFGGGVRVATGDVDGDGFDDVILGTGPGASQIRVYSGRTLSLLLAFSPFGVADDGVYVAAGDVNGDGRADIIVGSGSGGQVAVFSGGDGHELGRLFPFTPAYHGGVTVASGDFDGDGRSDVLAGTAVGGFVAILSGVDGHLIGSGFPFGQFFLGGVNLATGDVNGDGRLDVITATRSGASLVQVFSGVNYGVLASFTPYRGTGGVNVAAADVDRDGRADIITGPGAGTPLVRILSGADQHEITSFLAFEPGFLGGVFVATDPRFMIVGPPRFTSGTSASWTVGQFGAFAISTRGVPAATIALSGALPAGLSFSAASGGALIAGTPTAAGSASVTLTAVNALGTATQTLNITIGGGSPDNNPPGNQTPPTTAPAFTSAPATTLVAGTAGLFLITTTGQPAATLTITGALPSGVTFTDTGHGVATLAGTASPNSAGSYPLTITATNSSGAVPQSFVLTVNNNSTPAITSAAATTFAVGAPGSFTVTTVANPNVTSILETGALPTGVSFVYNGNGTATLSGTPAVGTAGVYPITFTASNGPKTAVQNFTLTVSAPSGGAPAITSANGVNFVTKTPGSFTITTTGTAPVTIATTSTMPSGVTLTNNGNGTATLAGTPAAGSAGTYPLTISASNGIGTTTQAFTLTVTNQNSTPQFTSGASTAFTVGLPGTFAVITTATVPFTTSITRTGTLPAGVTFTDNGDGTATLAGTPLAGSSGIYALTLTATNAVGGGTATQHFTLSVQQTALITSAASATFTTGVNGGFSITSTGVPTPAITVTPALPSGLFFLDNGDGTATIGGTPAAGTGGAHALTITATNGVGAAATQSFTLTVDDAGTFTSANTANFTLNITSAFSITTSSFPAPTITFTGSLPNGLTLTTAGLLSGTPTQSGSFPIVLTADNGTLPNPTQNLTIVVSEGPAITSLNSATFVLNTPGTTFQVTTTGFPAPTITFTGTLPNGLTLSTSGLLSGTPTQSGSFPVTLTAANGTLPDGTQNFTVFVNAPPAITSANTATFLLNTAGTTFQVTTTGFPVPTVSVLTGSLPTGLTLSPAGLLSGTPTQSGSFPVTLTAANGTLPNATQSFTVVVNEPPAITSANSATFLLNGVGTTFQVAMTGFPAPTVSVTTGTLPTGLTLSSAGLLSGTPTQFGSFPVTLTATNGILPDATQSFTVLVDTPPAITSANTATFDRNVPGTTFQVLMTGFPSPTVSVTAGALPPGLTLSALGLLSGTPTVGGNFPVTLTAVNGTLPNATQAFTVIVRQAPTFTSADNTAFVVGQAGTFPITTNGVPNAAFTAPGAILPTGVTFTNNGDGTATLSGTPAIDTNGSYTFTIIADNGIGGPVPQSFTLTVNNPSQPIITSANGATFNVGALESFTVTTAALPVAGTIAELGGLPAGVTFVNNGDGTATLSGRPNAGTAGIYPLTITASNGGPNTNQTFTLIVAPVAGAAPTITSANTTTFAIGALSTFTITTTGTPAASINPAGPLPPGVNFLDNGDGTATISGTPLAGTGSPLVSTAGLYPVTITVNNGVGTASQAFTLAVMNNVTNTPLFTSAPSAAFTNGVFGSFTVSTADITTAGLAKINGAFPTGVTFTDNHDGTGTLAGTPSGAATLYPLTFSALGGGSALQFFTLKVLQAPSITSVTSATFAVGQAGTFTVTTAGVPSPALSQTLGLPSGVNFTDNGNGTATLSGTPAAGTGGAHSLSFTAINGVGTAATQSFTLNINDAGSFTSQNSTTFTVGSNGSFLVTTQAFPSTGTITRGGVALPTGVSFTDHNDGTATLSGTPAAGTGGTYAISFTFNNGVGGPAVTQNFTLTVNQPPAITSANTATFRLNTTGTTFQVVMTGFPAPTVSVTVGTLPTGLTLSPAGLLSGTPTQSGSFPVTLTATNGIGSDATQSFTVLVNEPPAITSANATTFTTGTPGTFSVTTTGFPTGASMLLSETGALPTGVTFTDNHTGTATLAGTPGATTGGTYPITITANNGVNPNATQSFTLTVNQPPVAAVDAYTTDANTAISRTAAAVDDLLDNDSKGFPVATLTSFGAGSLGGAVTDHVAGATVTPLPAGSGSLTVGADGSFSFTPPTGFTGAFTFQYRLHNVAGDSDATVTINVRPKAVGDTLPATVLGNVVIDTAGTFTVTTNDIFNGTATLAAVSSTTAQGGTVTLNTSTGSFVYNPPVGYDGADSFQYTLTDNSGLTSLPATVSITVSGMIWFINNNIGACAVSCDGRETNPFTTLQAFTSVNDGAASHPKANDNIFAFESGTTYTFATGTVLQTGQKLIGQDGTATSLAALAGVTVPAGSTLPAMNPAGSATTLGSTVPLVNATAVKALSFAASGAAMTASGVSFALPVLIDQVKVSGGTNGLSLTNVNATASGAITVTASSFTNTAGAEVLVSGGNIPLSFDAATTISSNAGRSIDIQTHTTGAITFNGAITDTAQGINLTGNTGTTFTFAGGLSLSTGANPAFTATGGGTVNVCDENPCNPGATGGLVNTITTTTGTALNVANTSIGANNLEFRSISAGTGASGPANGIILNTTGSAGGLKVKGTGAANSGGTIQQTTAAGISLTSTTGPSFDRMQIQNTGSSGIDGTQVTNFTFTNGSISGAGNAGFESAIAFNGTGTQVGNNISGTLTVTGNTFTNPFRSGLDVQSDNGTVTNATVSNNTITNPGFSGVNFSGINNASTVFNLTKATIAGNTITGSGGNGIQVSISASNATGPGAIAGTVTINGNGVPVGDATNVISITGNAISLDSGGTQAITVANSGGNSGSRTQTNFIIQNNGTVGSPLVGSSIGTTILIGNNGFSDMAGLIDNNVINANHTANGGGGNGIAGGNGVTGAVNTPRVSLTVTNNTMTNTDGNGILLVGRGTTAGQAFFKIQNNNVAMPINAGGTGRPGIRVDAGNATSTDDAVFVNISGNTTAGSNGAPGIGIRKQGTVAGTNDFGIQGLSPSPATAAQAEDFVSAQNPNSTLGSAVDGFPVKHAYVISGDNFVTTTAVP